MFQTLIFTKGRRLFFCMKKHAVSQNKKMDFPKKHGIS